MTLIKVVICHAICGYRKTIYFCGIPIYSIEIPQGLVKERIL